MYKDTFADVFISKTKLKNPDVEIELFKGVVCDTFIPIDDTGITSKIAISINKRGFRR